MKKMHVAIVMVLTVILSCFALTAFASNDNPFRTTYGYQAMISRVPGWGQAIYTIVDENNVTMNGSVVFDSDTKQSQQIVSNPNGIAKLVLPNPEKIHVSSVIVNGKNYVVNTDNSVKSYNLTDINRGKVNWCVLRRENGQFTCYDADQL